MVCENRIFHGLHNIAGIPSSLAAFERAIGLNSKAFCYPNKFQSEHASELIRGNPADQLDYFTDNFDIFNFHFGASFFGQSLRDLTLLKDRGKKVILHYHGCDLRDSKLVLERHAINPCAECWPMSCNANRIISRTIRSEAADLITVSTPDLLEFEPKAVWLPQAVDLTYVRQAAERSEPMFRRKANLDGKAEDTVYIVHAPSASRLKGSRFLQQAIENLQGKGVKVELILLSGVPHGVVLASLREADLVVDQLLAGTYGVLAVEAMALGKPTLGYIREDLRETFPKELPIVNCRIDQIEENLLQIIEDRASWQELAAKSIAYVETYHEGSAVAKSLATSCSQL